MGDGSNMEWTNCEEKLPEIDYAAHKSATRVSIKYLDSNEEEHLANCYFRYLFNCKAKIDYPIFYDLDSGEIYKNVVCWKAIVP